MSSFRLQADHMQSDASLVTSVRKATSVDETAPKRKHVRSCIVFTWDHHTARPFWTAVKVQPLFASEIQTFKALIAIHRVLQEGHRCALKDSQPERGWLKTCARQFPGGEGTRGYSGLIRDYVDYLLDKLAFHAQHPEFNGTFEYKEYISLRQVDDPNEGYETVYDMMNLQDHIDDFQKQIFSSFKRSSKNECRISALVPLVQESYGIYRFLISMLRALYKTIDGADTLEPLKQRYISQHHRLRHFYADCSNLRYLTSLISVPRLPHDPPDLEGDDNLPELPKRPASVAPQPTGTSSIGPQQTGSSSQLEMNFPSANDIEPVPNYSEPESIQEFWSEPAYDQQIAAQQQALAAQQSAEMERQRLAAQQHQQAMEAIQRAQADQQRAAQEQMFQQQMQMQSQGQLAGMEQQLAGTRAQLEQSNMLLHQYDARVKALENELNQSGVNIQEQIHQNDDLIDSLRSQISTWKSKYEALAKLYTQLRQEHLDLLSKYKQLQLKANSAQEAIEKKERMEREIKNKNLELADMILERDRARHELDTMHRAQRGKQEANERELRLLQEKATSLERSKSSELSGLLSRYNREVAELEESLRIRDQELDGFRQELNKSEAQYRKLLQEKEEEVEIQKAAVDESLLQLKNLQLDRSDVDQAMDSQIDDLLKSQLEKLSDIVDSVLFTGIQRLDTSLHELDSPMHAGNQYATPEFVLSIIENASNACMDFATAFNNYFADGPNADHSEVINSVNSFSTAMSEVSNNSKGLSRSTGDDQGSDQLVSQTRQMIELAKRFLSSLFSHSTMKMDVDQKTEMVINENVEMQQRLQQLSQYSEKFLNKESESAVGLLSTGGDNIEELVDRQLAETANAIQNAIIKLQGLAAQPKDVNLSPSELQVHDSLLAASIAITEAIARLIKAATASQAEIVAQGRGSSSRGAFYKKHNRWTEGLISAAKAVARATVTLIETADGVINGKASFEHLIVASNGVAAATAQLVAASRVKATFASKTQDHLEEAAKAVTDACKALVRQVETMALRSKEMEHEDFSSLGVHEYRRQEMEQQVQILKIENELVAARRRLFDMRKTSYHVADE
ncbi:huntingtin-interacting protein [Schizosaccharomyces cryophilus OY26]|uniref:Huntingtin-interacting protein n=1 Tax=Schizosaccharomyces cryophilus (strain OY26 / ATCC MYA-4695 / CBS 11777 / NBRC 106824 / NRRL Y48691) TaxID=653667 RepID=S9XI91_SCHCR|nr:huntingtin-interacting protein [Schizosaccharomyces cryophilus OY26]EPY53376.1 huntingtin-interacting protein [Schizosaccharomyces cryophilus OY26]